MSDESKDCERKRGELQVANAKPSIIDSSSEYPHQEYEHVTPPWTLLIGWPLHNSFLGIANAPDLADFGNTESI